MNIGLFVPGDTMFSSASLRRTLVLQQRMGEVDIVWLQSPFRGWGFPLASHTSTENVCKAKTIGFFGSDNSNSDSFNPIVLLICD
ncbi:MAG: hypothetical protein JWQ40_5194 [Segetibacter sp.]|nr:hypothetical protein [Segetibacter sp.]